MNLGAGVLDEFVGLGGRPKVHVSSSFLPGMRVSVYRPNPMPLGWKKLATLTISEIPVDFRGWTTNEILFTEPMPEYIKQGDVLIYESKEQ